MEPRYCADTYLRFVEPFYQERDPAHDFRHIQRLVHRLPVLSVGISPEPRLDMLYFLACFHGLDKRMTTDPAFVQAAKRFLQSVEWQPAEFEEAVLRLSRHLKTPATVEEQIVYDANYVELLGAFGIAKAFTKGGAEGQSYEETADIYEQYLNKVEFKTPAGQQLAAHNRDFAKDFLHRLRTEL